MVVQGNASRVVAWHGGGGTPLGEPGGDFLGHEVHLRWSPPVLPASSAVDWLDFNLASLPLLNCLSAI